MFYAGVSLGSASQAPTPTPACVSQGTGPLPGSGEGHSLSPGGDALCPPQTAFSDFLMGSSKDLAKHIRVVVSGPLGGRLRGRAQREGGHLGTDALNTARRPSCL